MHQANSKILAVKLFRIKNNLSDEMMAQLICKKLA